MVSDLSIASVLITAFVGLSMGTIGIVIGFYRSSSKMATNYISKTDCERCAVKKTVKESSIDLKEGRKAFEEIRIDIALIKQKLGVEE